MAANRTRRVSLVLDGATGEIDFTAIAAAARPNRNSGLRKLNA